MSIRYTPKIIFFVLLACILSARSWAGNFDRDPIIETQTKPVAVTPETLKDPKPGAPAPSYKMIEDSSEFFDSKPNENIPVQTVKKAPAELPTLKEPSDWGAEDEQEETFVEEVDNSDLPENHDGKSFELN